MVKIIWLSKVGERVNGKDELGYGFVGLGIVRHDVLKMDGVDGQLVETTLYLYIF